MRFFKPKSTIFRENGIPLLYRWNLFECSLFSIKVHKLLTSDDACLHDHPWAFITFLISGGYIEHTMKGSFRRRRFSILYRPARFAHKIEISKPVWTFVITFKKVKQWGFYTPRGWVKWYQYDGKNQCE